MYQFVKFSDLGPFTDIIHSNARFVNAPVGMLLDRKGRVLGHRMAPLSTRRFGTFQGTAGEDSNLGGVLVDRPVAPEFSLARLTELPDDPSKIPSVPFEEKTALGFLESVESVEEGPSLDLDEEIRARVELELKKAERRSRARSAIRKARYGPFAAATASKKAAIKKAALAGIKASNKGDDVTAFLIAMSEAGEAGLSPDEAEAVGRSTEQAVRKHMKMEEKEATAVAQEVTREEKHSAGVKRTPSGGRSRGRPRGKSTQGTGELKGKTNKQLGTVVKAMGMAPSQFTNKRQLLGAIEGVASDAKTPVKSILEASEGRRPMPALVRIVSEERETERKSRGRTLTRGTSRIRGKTRQSRRAESPAAFVANPSGRGRGSYKRTQKKK